MEEQKRCCKAQQIVLRSHFAIPLLVSCSLKRPCAQNDLSLCLWDRPRPQSNTVIPYSRDLDFRFILLAVVLLMAWVWSIEQREIYV